MNTQNINWGAVAVDCVIIAAVMYTGNYWLLLLMFLTGGYWKGGESHD